VLLISPDGRGGSALIHQDAEVWRVKLAPGEIAGHQLAADRGLWLQVMRGTLRAGSDLLAAGDAVSTETPGTLEFQAGDEPLEALLFDLS